MRLADFPFQASFQLLKVEDETDEKTTYRVMRPGDRAPLSLSHFQWGPGFPLEKRAETVQNWKRRLSLLKTSGLPFVTRIEEFGDNQGRPYVCVEASDERTLAEALAREGASFHGEFHELAAALIEAAIDLLNVGVPVAILTPLNIRLSGQGGIRLSLEDLYDQEPEFSESFALKKHYLPPERSGKYLDALDFVWSVGATLFQIQYRRHPFASVESPRDDRTRIYWPAGEPAPPAVKAFFEKALNRDRAKRFRSLEEMKRAAAALDFSAAPQDRVAPKSALAALFILATIVGTGWLGFRQLDLSGTRAERKPERPAASTPSGIERRVGDARNGLEAEPGPEDPEPEEINDGTAKPPSDVEATKPTARKPETAAAEPENKKVEPTGAASKIRTAREPEPSGQEELPKPPKNGVGFGLTAPDALPGDGPAKMSPDSCANGGSLTLTLTRPSMVIIDGKSERRPAGPAVYPCLPSGMRSIRISGVDAPLLRSFTFPILPGSDSAIVLDPDSSAMIVEKPK